MKFQASVFRAAHACCPCFADARIPDSNHEGGKTSMRNYTTQMDAARKGILTPELEIVAKKENMTTEALMKLVAEGKVVPFLISTVAGSILAFLLITVLEKGGVMRELSSAH